MVKYHNITVAVFVGEDPTENKWGLPADLVPALMDEGSLKPEDAAKGTEGIMPVIASKGNFGIMSILVQYLGKFGYQSYKPDTTVRADMLTIAHFRRELEDNEPFQYSDGAIVPPSMRNV